MNNQETRIIKVILPGMCPHCNKEILTAVRTVTPTVDWILKKEDIQIAKEKTLKLIEESNISQKEKESASKWISHEETLFGPDEVEEIVNQLTKK